jgi:hypothetical protein
MPSRSRATPLPVEDWRRGLEPPEQLRRQLERMRAIGKDFDSAWELATGRIRWDHDKETRGVQKCVVEWARPAFERAYRREEPLPGELAAASLLEALAGDPIWTGPPDRRMPLAPPRAEHDAEEAMTLAA